MEDDHGILDYEEELEAVQPDVDSCNEDMQLVWESTPSPPR